MFAGQHSVRLSPDFLLREKIESILPGQGMNQGVHGAFDSGDELVERGENVGDHRPRGIRGHNHQGFPMLKLDIPMFDGVNPRW